MITIESPLGGMNIGTIATVAIRELQVLPAIDLRVAPGTSAQVAVCEALGVDLPGKPGQSIVFSVTGGEAYILCLAPDWWIIAGFREAEQKLKVLSLNADLHFSVVDVSGQRTTIELEGSTARELLSGIWEQDLREKSFPVSGVSQGLMAKAPVIVFHFAQSRYRIMVRSSFALHLWKVLADAAEEWI
jgi:sarcosine oxidase subunit gamma